MAQTYMTQSDDTLWDIAVRFYHDGSKWPVVYDANRQAIGASPTTLSTGVALTIPTANTTPPPPITAMAPTPIPGTTITDSPVGLYYNITRSFHAFARSTSGKLVQHYGMVWEDLGAPPSGISGSPGAVVREPASLHVAVRGGDTRLYHKYYNGNAWSDWENRGGDLASSPSLVSWNPMRLDIFGRGLFRNLIHSWWDMNTGWVTWEDLSAKLPVRYDIQFAPSAASWGQNRIDVVAVRAGDNHLLHAWWDGRSWQGWEDLGGVVTESPSIVSRSFNTLDIFVRGSDNQLYVKSWNGQRWSEWAGLKATLVSAPSAAINYHYEIVVLARSSSNELVTIR